MIVNNFESSSSSYQFKNKKWVDNMTADSKGKKETSDKEQVVISFGGSRRQSAAGCHGYGRGFLVGSL